jgi:hypothetical protein
MVDINNYIDYYKMFNDLVELLYDSLERGETLSIVEREILQFDSHNLPEFKRLNSNISDCEVTFRFDFNSIEQCEIIYDSALQKFTYINIKLYDD